MNGYLKRKVANNNLGERTFNYKISISELEEYYDDDGLPIHINYDFLRKYTHISFTINEGSVHKKTFLLDLIFTDFDIVFNKKTYKIIIYNNFLDNMSRKPNTSDIYLTTNVYIQDYVNGFLFEHSLSDTCTIKYNISLTNSNIIKIANMGLLTNETNYGDVYLIFRPTNIFTSQLLKNDIYDTLDSIEYI